MKNKQEIVITAMIVVRNEEEYIKLSLKSLLEQDFPEKQYEIIVVDGNSTDSTLDNIKLLKKEYKGKTKITILENPKKLLAAGWNIGIKEAKGKYVVRIDAHAEAKKDFLKTNLETMKKLPKDVACVGGKLESVTLAESDKTISKILSSPFGIGNSKFRYADKSQYVDTVAYGLYKKEVFDEVGYFDETLERNKDNNMHDRIISAGYKFYFNPKIQSKYYVRNSLKKLLRQGFLNGKWNIIVFRQSKKSLSLRHLIPLLFVLSIIGLSLLALLSKYFIYLLGIEMILYFGLAIIFAVKKTKNVFEIFKMMSYFFMFHIAYGLGSVISIFKGKGEK